MKVVCISCFDYYDIRMKKIIDFFEKKGGKVRYLYADYNHYSKKYDNRKHKNGVSIHVPDYVKNLSLARLNSHRVFTKSVGKYLRKERPEIVYCLFPPNLLAEEVIAYKKKNKKTKVAFDIYDTWPESIPIGKLNLFAKLPFFIWKNIRDRNIRYADELIVVSNDFKNYLKKKLKTGGIPIHVLYPVIEGITRPEYLFNKNEYITFCYLGNVNYITDTDLLIALFEKLAKLIKVRIHFIGRGKNMDEFINNLKRFGVESINHGCVFDIEKKNAIFELCDMGINAPKLAVNSSMSLKSVEYLRAGLPFINSGRGDNEIMVATKHIGINIERNRLSDTAKTIAELTSVDLRKMHQNCIECYQNSYINQNMDQILREII